MLTIRPMTSGDIDTVLKLEAETPEAPHWDRAVYERMLAQENENAHHRVAWVAVNELKLLGFVVAHFVAGVCEIESIAVSKSARRMGIGRSLLNAVTHWAQAGSAHKLELEVRAGNESAIGFYERAGFLREGLRRGYYRDPDDDAVLMGKHLYSGD
jgi:ribosomal-protein-alanine N-acetyltransferase